MNKNWLKELEPFLEDDEQKLVEGIGALKGKVKAHLIKFEGHYNKNGNCRTQSEAMADRTHQGGDIARKGAIESHEKAKKQKKNPQPITEYFLGERNIKKKEISPMQHLPDTITRTHPTFPKDKLEARPLKGKSAKEI